MGYHHLALAARDMTAIHHFYEEVMGFELVKVEVARSKTGFMKHLFYSTGSATEAMIAFWDIQDPALGDEWSADISRGLGLPRGLNHLAFSASDLDDIARRRDRWLAYGRDVAEIDHGWCTSIYTEDPNGIMVEFCVLTKSFTDADKKEALELLSDANPTAASGYVGRKFYKAADYPR
jgi:catechol 2,3-dioxygenase-like lactoylglutathione lyase family enzyme